MEELNLSGCDSRCDSIGDQYLSPLISCTKLKRLDLSNLWKIQDRDLEVLRHLKELEELNLSECDSIMGKGLANLLFCPKLKKLYLSALYMQDQDLAVLICLTELEELDLSGCKSITEKGLANLSSYTKFQITLEF